MRTCYTNLPCYFTIKTYSLVPTTWSMFVMQQSPNAPMNMFQPHWRDAGLQTTLDSMFGMCDERLRMVWQGRLTHEKCSSLERL